MKTHIQRCHTVLNQKALGGYPPISPHEAFKTVPALTGPRPSHKSLCNFYPKLRESKPGSIPSVYGAGPGSMPRFHPPRCGLTSKQVSQVPIRTTSLMSGQCLGQDAPFFIPSLACPFLRTAHITTLELLLIHLRCPPLVSPLGWASVLGLDEQGPRPHRMQIWKFTMASIRALTI